MIPGVTGQSTDKECIESRPSKVTGKVNKILLKLIKYCFCFDKTETPSEARQSFMLLHSFQIAGGTIAILSDKWVIKHKINQTEKSLFYYNIHSSFHKCYQKIFQQ